MAEKTEEEIMAADTGTETEVSKADEETDITLVENVTVGPVVKSDSFTDDRHINLTWRSWMVVL